MVSGPSRSAKSGTWKCTRQAVHSNQRADGPLASKVSRSGEERISPLGSHPRTWWNQRGSTQLASGLHRLRCGLRIAEFEGGGELDLGDAHAGERAFDRSRRLEEHRRVASVETQADGTGVQAVAPQRGDHLPADERGGFGHALLRRVRLRLERDGDGARLLRERARRGEVARDVGLAAPGVASPAPPPSRVRAETGIDVRRGQRGEESPAAHGVLHALGLGPGRTKDLLLHPRRVEAADGEGIGGGGIEPVVAQHAPQAIQELGSGLEFERGPGGEVEADTQLGVGYDASSQGAADRDEPVQDFVEALARMDVGAVAEMDPAAVCSALPTHVARSPPKRRWGRGGGGAQPTRERAPLSPAPVPGSVLAGTGARDSVPREL